MNTSMATAGELNVYGKLEHTQYTLLASATVPNPVQIRYISFASWESNAVEYFYDCAMPMPAFEGVSTKILSKQKHKLFNDPILPPDFDKRNCKNLISKNL